MQNGPSGAFEVSSVRIVLGIAFVLVLAVVAVAAEPVAVVNGEEISRETLQQRTNLYSIVLTIYQQFPSFAETLLLTDEGRAFQRRYERDTLEQLILRSLQLQEARKRDVHIDEERLTSRVDGILGDIMLQNQLTEDELIEVLAQQGRTLEGFREEITANVREDLLIDGLYGIVIGEITVDDASIEAYYADNKDSFQDDDGNIQPLSDVREEIHDRLLQRARRDHWDAWLKTLREEADVTVKL